MFKIFKKKKKAQRYKPKKKMEFSKKFLLGSIICSIVFTTFSYILALLDKSTVEALSIEVINTLWGSSAVAFVFYTGQNSVRAFTSSRWGIPLEDGNTKRNDKNEIEEIIEEDEVIE